MQNYSMSRMDLLTRNRGYAIEYRIKMNNAEIADRNGRARPAARPLPARCLRLALLLIM